MDVKCPFCSEVVEVPEGSSESSEIECPSCRAGFDVTAARLFSEDADVEVEEASPRDEPKETEAWLRDESDPDDQLPGPPETDAEPASEEASPATEAWIRDEAEPPPRPKPRSPDVPLGGYGFSRKDLSHADEVFLPPDAVAARKKKSEAPQEPVKPLVDELETVQEPDAHSDVSPPPPPPVDFSEDVLSPEGAAPEPGIQDEPPAEQSSLSRVAPPADNIFDPASGMTEKFRSVEPPSAEPSAEPVADFGADLGLDLGSDMGSDLGTELPSFDDLVPPDAGADAGPSAGQPEEDMKDPTRSWMGVGPSDESTSLPPPPQEDAGAGIEPVAPMETSGPVSVTDFDIPDSLDMVQNSGFDGELPDPKDSVGLEAEGTEATAEWAGATPGEAPGGLTEGLDLSFDDLEIPGQEPGQEPGQGAVDTAAIGSLDIDAALSEDSEPDTSLPFDTGDVPDPGSQAEIGGVDSIFEAGETGSSSVLESPDISIGLPDAWPEGFDADENAGDGSAPDMEIPPVLDLDAGAGPPVGPTESLDLDLSRSLETEMVPEAAEPPMATQKAAAAVRQRKVQVGGSGIKLAMMGLLLVVLLGVILGQTEYGYFGFNLFVPDDMELTTGKKAIPPPGQSTGIVRDTKESYLEEVTRLEALVREDPEDAKPKADLLEVLMRFRERYPGVIASKPKLVARLEFLEKQTAVTGQKAGMVKVMDLVNGGSYQEAKAVLDGMVVATAQDADVLYFYGKITLGQGKLDEAQKYFELALMKNPALLAAKYFLARTQIRKKNEEKGKAILEEILQTEPGHIATKVTLAELALKAQNEDSAARLAGDVISKANSDAYAEELFAAHLVMAEVQKVKGTKEGRMQELRAALAIKPADESTALLVSGLLTELNDVDDALNILEPCRQKGCDSEEYLATYARAAFAAEKDELAGQALKDGSAKYPQSPVFSIIRGSYLLDAGRPRAASSAFEESTRIDPTSVEGNVMLAKALSKEGKLHEATGRLIKGLEHATEKIPLLVTLASIYREKRDFVAAEETLRKVVAMDPSNAGAKQTLGLVVLSLDRAAEASKILMTLDQRHALDREGALGLAESYLRLGEAQKARNVLSRLYGKAEDDPDVAAEYGRALSESGKLKKAHQVLLSVINARPSHAAGHFYLGRLHAKQGHLQKAADELLRSVQLKTGETRYRLELARVLLRREGTDHVRDAKLHLDKVINAYVREEVDPEQWDADAYMMRGTLLFDQEKFSLAMRDFEAALALAPSRLDLLLGFGTTLYEMARYDEAVPYFRQVLKRDGSHADANYYLGRILLRKGQIESAKSHLEMVSKRNAKKFPEALRYLGLIYRDQKLRPMARKTFMAYLRVAPKNTPEANEVKRLLERM